MAFTTEIKGIKELIAKIKASQAKAIKDGQTVVRVGYQTNYVIYVHENLQAAHAEGKQAKFLEEPARRLRKELVGIVVQALRKGLTLTQALLRAALRLQRESQLLVPIDTRLLKNSAFTEVEKQK